MLLVIEITKAYNIKYSVDYNYLETLNSADFSINLQNNSKVRELTHW